MKKIYIGMLMLLVTLSLTACVFSEFSGSRMGNESQLIMEYKVLNKTETQELELSAGDVVSFKVVNKGGGVDISLQKGSEEPIYEGVNIPTSDFSVEIEEAGRYTVSVTGKHARGSVAVTREN